MVMKGAGLRPIGKPLDAPPYPTIMRALHFYPDSVSRPDSSARTGHPDTRLSPRSARDTVEFPIRFIRGRTNEESKGRRPCARFSNCISPPHDF